MALTDILQIAGIIIAGLIALMLGLGYFIGQFQKGKLERQKDETTVKQGVFDLLRDEVDELEKRAAENNQEITKMKTLIAEKDKQINEWKEIFQNRNPEITNFIATSYAYYKDTGLFFTELKLFFSEMKELVRNVSQALEEHHEAVIQKNEKTLSKLANDVKDNLETLSRIGETASRSLDMKVSFYLSRLHNKFQNLINRRRDDS